MSIKVSNVSKFYGAQAALNHVSFEVERGRVVGLLGPNGAGKSTMMKILAGFIPPSSGEALVGGFNVAAQPLQARKIVGYLPEHNPLYLDMYVGEFLAFVAGVYGLKKKSQQAVSEAVEVTGLSREAHKKIGQLSKGYRQRVGLAQALLHNPDVLILDEPTAGLDPNQLSEIRQLIVRVGREKTVMLSTHIMQEVEAMCDRVIIIKEGQIVAHDTPQHVRQQASEEAAGAVEVEFMEEVSRSVFAQVESVARAEEVAPRTFLLTARGAEDIRPAIFQMSVKENITILKIQRHEKPLEEVFRDLTAKNV
ncbi:MAG: gliding motility-associated ABC transporter ATP-binding subunit GldA [Prevotellaceae bacterium]|jgi:ABC-2 type transport system ATP-binding protein|nr:gliding motility-associated ABC transporter ATP-binding subunit GldA [Prevotellaceae bacterium]